MWRCLFLLLWACGPSTTSQIGDMRCAVDGDCTNADRCALVTSTRVGTGDCLASSGVKVCRPVCNDCTKAVPCGCQCP